MKILEKVADVLIIVGSSLVLPIINTNSEILTYIAMAVTCTALCIQLSSLYIICKK